MITDYLFIFAALAIMSSNCLLACAFVISHYNLLLTEKWQML